MGGQGGMEHIGKYGIHKAVVTTGYARIFLGHDPDLQVPVAIKLFDPKPDADGPLSPAQQLNRFVTEARVLASFDHPYIIGVKVLEQLGDGRPYFVMPFMAAHLPYEIGKDFATAEEEMAAPDRDKPKRLVAARAMIAVKQLAAAALALHRRNLVHRFIRPSNILLTANQNGGVKLCDFSMVKLPERNLPLPDHWMRTADYTAPEQLDNATAATARSDVYSIGLIAYRLLVGRLPDRRLGAAVLPDLFPSPLIQLVAACTDPDPERRPAHAGEVLGALERVPSMTQPPSRPVVESVPPKRQPAAARS
jgi:serine/threonine-protein kinase